MGRMGCVISGAADPFFGSIIRESHRLSDAVEIRDEDASPCTTCGACCCYSSEWPRFTTESDAALDRIPEKLVKDDLSGMRCEGVRCSALVGQIGEQTACSIYADRPDVCRACMPGDDACQMAREKFGLPIIVAV